MAVNINTLITGSMGLVPPPRAETRIWWSDGNYSDFSKSGELTKNDIDSWADGEHLLQEAVSIEIGSNVTSISNSLFQSCSGITSVTIPDSVTIIGKQAFNNCSGLMSMTIPNSVTSIGENVFDGCKNLTTITIPNKITSIPTYMCFNCKNLTSVTIPNSVTSIGEGAFSGYDITKWCNIDFTNTYSNPIYYSHRFSLNG